MPFLLDLFLNGGAIHSNAWLLRISLGCRAMPVIMMLLESPSTAKGLELKCNAHHWNQRENGSRSLTYIFKAAAGNNTLNSM